MRGSTPLPHNHPFGWQIHRQLYPHRPLSLTRAHRGSGRCSDRCNDSFFIPIHPLPPRTNPQNMHFSPSYLQTTCNMISISYLMTTPLDGKPISSSPRITMLPPYQAHCLHEIYILGINPPSPLPHAGHPHKAHSPPSYLITTPLDGKPISSSSSAISCIFIRPSNTPRPPGHTWHTHALLNRLPAHTCQFGHHKRQT